MERGTWKTEGKRGNTGSSSDAEEQSTMWKWDGESWWCKIEYKGAINSKLRRRIFRSVRATLDQEAKRWKEWSQLRTRIEWLEAREQEGLEQGKQNSDDLVGFQHMVPGFSRGSQFM